MTAQKFCKQPVNPNWMLAIASEEGATSFAGYCPLRYSGGIGRVVDNSTIDELKMALQ